MAHAAQDGNRRMELIDATVRSIAEHGISSVTVAKISANADLSPGIVNFYFDSKRELLLDTLRHLETEFNEVVSEHLDGARAPEDKLRAIVHAHFDERLFCKDKVAVWYAFWGESQARRDYRKLCERSDSEVHQQIRGLFGQLLTGSEASIDAAARGLEGIIEGFWQQALYDDSRPDASAAISACEAYLDLTLPAAGRESLRQPASRASSVDERFDYLAPWAYLSEELLDLEIDHMFRPKWTLAGHVSDLPDAGSYQALDIFGERGLIIRGRDGIVRAFHNLCRHRGTRLVEGAGRCKRMLSCPFHGWRYEFDGSLAFVPGAANGFPDIDRSAHGLVPLDLEIWNGFIFIRFASDGTSVAEHFAPVEDHVANYRLPQLQPCRSREEYHYDVNWKVFADVDNEGYHVPIGHPALQALYGSGYTDSTAGEIMLSHGPFNEKLGSRWSVRLYRDLLPEFDHLNDDESQQWLYVGLFPNTVFALYPEMMETYQYFPVGVDRCKIISRSYALEDDRREVRAVRYLNRRINGQTEFEDRTFMKWLQESMQSSAYPNWMLSKTAETGVAEFYRMYQDILPVASLREKPASVPLAEVNETLVQRR